MQELINRLLSNNLRDFEGLKIIGSIPVSEQIVNEFASEFIEKFFAKQTESTPNSIPTESITTQQDTPAAMDYMSVLKYLEVHNFKVSFEKEKMIVNVDVRR